MTDTCTYMGDSIMPCGCVVVKGRSYCEQHLWLVYQKGSNLATRHKDKRVATAVWNIQDAFNEAVAELEQEGFDINEERWDAVDIED